MANIASLFIIIIPFHKSLSIHLKYMLCTVDTISRYRRNILDDFTFISTRGRSVVDYTMVPHVMFKYVNNFNVIQVNDLIDKFDLVDLLSTSCKAPDHAVVTFSVNISQTLTARYRGTGSSPSF